MVNFHCHFFRRLNVAHFRQKWKSHIYLCSVFSFTFSERDFSSTSIKCFRITHWILLWIILFFMLDDFELISDWFWSIDCHVVRDHFLHFPIFLLNSFNYYVSFFTEEQTLIIKSYNCIKSHYISHVIPFFNHWSIFFNEKIFIKNQHIPSFYKISEILLGNITSINIQYGRRFLLHF